MAQLSTMNSINDLAEYGFIRTFEPGDYTISLHPMIRDITDIHKLQSADEFY